jgi:hypothetical protein
MLEGLPLVVTFDALFDAGRISFEDSCEMLVSRNFSNKTRTVLRVEGLTQRHFPPVEMTEYLVFHRKDVFIQSMDRLTNA